MLFRTIYTVQIFTNLIINIHTLLHYYDDIPAGGGLCRYDNGLYTSAASP